MPYLDLPSHRLHYRLDGEPDKPWLTFCNSLGTDLRMWDAQIADLAQHFRILRYDRRGHGDSGVPTPPYSVADLGSDVVALLDTLRIDRTHFCGLSIGGLVGQWLGVHASHRLERIILCSTAARIGTAESWNARIDEVRSTGLSHLVPATAERWFSPGYHATHSDLAGAILNRFAATPVDGYIGCCAALSQADFRNQLQQIPNPLLAVSGDDDPVCRPLDLEVIANSVQQGNFVSLPGRHIVNLEASAQFNTVLKDFLTHSR